jgi:hypothetical protein
MSQYIERIKKALKSKQRHPVMMEHRRGGDLYFKSGKDACMSSNVKTLHIFFILLQEKSSMQSSKIGDQKKESLS